MDLIQGTIHTIIYLMSPARTHWHENPPSFLSAASQTTPRSARRRCVGLEDFSGHIDDANYSGADMQARCDLLEDQLRIARERCDRFEVGMAEMTLLAHELELELENERELCRELRAAIHDNSIADTIERIIARHAVAMENERMRLEAATMRHERAILDLVESHRTEVTTRLNAVLDQNRELFNQFNAAIRDEWVSRGTTRPSLAKEHWLIVAKEETEEDDGTQVVTFKIHSGQKSYIDRISSLKNIILERPAANGVDVRQTAKKRLREQFHGQDVSAFW